MSSSRNKRKRPENDTSGAAPTPRRRSTREQRAAPAEQAALSTDGKNEEKAATAMASSSTATSAEPEDSRESPQHTKEVNSKSVHDVDKYKTADVSETSEKETLGPVNVDGNDDVGDVAPTEEDPGSGTIQEESLPSQSIDSDDTERVKDERSDAENASESNNGSRESRIQAILSHRKLLLHRIKLCRAVAEGRLDTSIPKSDTNKADAKTTGKKGGTSQTDGNNMLAIDEEEIASFREMTRLAILAAKKSRSDGDSGAPEKRTSLSLRRGSSVGKRMNAALSSLAPGASTPTSLDAHTQTLQGANPLSMKYLPKTPQAATIAPKPIESTAPAIRPPNTTSGPPVVPPSSKLTKSTSSQVVQRQGSVGIPAKYESVQKGRALNSKGVKSISNSTSRMPSTIRHETTTMPLHIGAGSTALPQNRLAQPKVVFPEAVALREQRNRVRSKLAALLDRRKHDQVRSEDTISSPGVGARSRTKPTRQAASWELRGAARLPRRRKTHWDHLLQEMTWMATDFIEERKWKLSSARTLGSAILSPSFVAVSPRPGKNTDGFRSKASGQTSNDAEDPSATKPEKISSRNKTAPRKPQKQEIRQYVVPSLEDAKSIRGVASIVSCMVTELGEATLDSGSDGVSADANGDALESFHLFQGKHDGDPPNISSVAGEVPTENLVKEGNVDACDDASPHADSSCDIGVKQPVGTVESVTSFVDASCRAVLEIKEKISKRAKTKADAYGVAKLSSWQKDATEFVNELWKREESLGAILAGPAASGKTIAACSLIWKQRSNGPQLLVCPPAGVIRWVHELGKFADLRVTSFGCNRGISSRSNFGDGLEHPDVGDVVVCEYASVSRALSTFWKHRAKFQSITIDCRHPIAFSRWHGITPESDESPTKRALGYNWNGPAELLSMDWWGDITNFLRHSPARRLIIEFPGPDALSLATSGLNDRHQIEILAFRAAIILGPKAFNSPGVTLLRRILSWARQYGKKMRKDKIERLRKVFTDVTEKFSVLSPEGLGDPSIWSRGTPWYEVRGCQLPPTQRAEYDKACSEVRGSLACCLELAQDREDSVFHSFKAVSTSLLRLRRLCFHSNLQSLISSPPMRSRIGSVTDIIMNSPSRTALGDGGSGIFFRKVADSPSQPDSSIAFSILEGSGKMRELVRLLRNECDLKVCGDEVLAPLLGSQDNPKCSKSRSSKKVSRFKKVAILAVLPEVQILVSTLLSSIGINHDLLLRASTGEVPLPDASKGSPSYSEDEKFESASAQTLALAWSEYQTSLAKFNLETSSGDSKIVIASPGCIAGYGGLGVESADLIVCLDEDWSGRSAFVMQYVTSRWLMQKRISSSDVCRLIRLVCIDTCEEKLLASSKKSGNEPSGTNGLWPLGETGHFCFPKSSSDAISLYLRPPASPAIDLFVFPGVNLMQRRGDDLEDVLSPSTKLPQLFGSSSGVQFLPYSESGNSALPSRTEDSVSVKAEVNFIQDLLVREKLASLGRTLVKERKGSSMVEEAADSLALTSFCVFPPSSASFPKLLITRKDLEVLSSRLYFERLVKSAVWTSLGSSVGGATVDQVQDPAVSGARKADVTSSNVISNNSDLADAWRKSGLSCKPDDTAASLLFYRASQNTDGQEVQNPSVDAQKVSTPIASFDTTKSIDLRVRRSNIYARAFTTTQDGNLLRDGNQGREPLVYFPPLFPRLLQCSIQASKDFDAMVAKGFNFVGVSGPEGSTAKRKDSVVGENVDGSSAKKPRIEVEQELPSVNSASPATAQPQLHEAVLAAPRQTHHPNPDAPYASSSGTPGPVAVSGDGVDDLPLGGEDDATRGLLSSDLAGFGEDFGLLGVGAMALPSDAMIAMSYDSIETGDSATITARTIGYELSSSTIPCDIEEAEAAQSLDGDNVNLDSMILFVKKKPRGFAPLHDPSRQLYRQPHGALLPETPWSGPKSASSPSIIGIGSSFTDVNGTGGPKKAKKKGASQAITSIPASSFSRLQSADVIAGAPITQGSASMQLPKGKDGFRNRVLASFMSRQIHTGLTMFESASYQVAAVRVLNRLGDRFARQCWKVSLSNEFGPGIPLSIAKHQNAIEVSRKRGTHEGEIRSWSSIAKRLKINSFTGDAAKSLALSQRSSLRRSLISPCRVDFGPFKSGFLSLPSGMTGISPPKSRLGISLPMGVKVPQPLREHQQQSWSSTDDRRLQDFAVRFGMNWMLVARALSGLEDIILSPGGENNNELNRRSVSFPRSARQCRDRWEALARNQPSLANEVRKSERDLRENAHLRTNDIPGADDAAMTIHGPGHQADVSLLSKPSNVFEASKKEPPMTKEESEASRPQGVQSATNGTAHPEADKAASVLRSEDPSQGLKNPRRSFGFLSRAKSKTQVFPLTIPGAVGGNPPTLVASHPSHMASVQESAAAQSSSGRTEMWPLQILDVADKQRAAASAAQRASVTTAASAGNPQSNGPSPSNASSSANRRQTTPSGSTHSHRPTSYQASSSTTRPASFPPVPGSSGRTSSSSQHRQQQQGPSSSAQQQQHSNTSPPRTQGYAPPPPPGT